MGGQKPGIFLLKKRIDDLLFLVHKFLAFFLAVRLAFDVDHGAAMQNAIQDGQGNGDVSKYLVLLGEGIVKGKESGRFLVASGNQLKEQVCALDIHGKVADLVNNEHPVLSQDLEFIGQALLEMGLFETLNELVTVDIISKAQGRSQICLAYAWGRETLHSPRFPGSAWWPVRRFGVWSIEGWKEKSKLPRVFLMGKPDNRICFS